MSPTKERYQTFVSCCLSTYGLQVWTLTYGTYTLAKVIDDTLGAESSNWDRFLLLFFFFWPFTLCINLLFLPPAHICFLHLHSCWKLLSISLFNTFPYQSSTGLIWSLHNSSSSVSWPFRGLAKQTASSKWNLNLNSEPWAFILREILHQERQLYTLADALTQGNTIRPTRMSECALISTTNDIWILSFPNFNLISLLWEQCPSPLFIRFTPTADNVFPWPQLQDESCGRPFNFLGLFFRAK